MLTMAARKASDSLNALFNASFVNENDSNLLSTIEDYFCFNSDGEDTADSGNQSVKVSNVVLMNFK